MKVVIAGNYDLDPSRVAMHLLKQLAELPIDASVLLRSPLSGQPGPIEHLAEELCRSLEMPVEWRVPMPGSGGEGTIDRDYRMVDESDGVIAYFHPDHIMGEDRGTTRLVRHAIAVDKPVQAFSVGVDSTDWVGSIEEGAHA